jgi:hypothetical protein
VRYLDSSANRSVRRENERYNIGRPYNEYRHHDSDRHCTDDGYSRGDRYSRHDYRSSRDGYRSSRDDYGSSRDDYRFSKTATDLPETTNLLEMRINPETIVILAMIGIPEIQFQRRDPIDPHSDLEIGENQDQNQECSPADENPRPDMIS